MATSNLFEVSNHTDDTGKTTKLTILCASSFENIDLIDEQTRQFLEKLNLDAEIFSISLVSREGLLNAVVHAHQHNSSKTMQYSIQYVDSTIVIEIKDQGEGFDWQEALKAEPNPEDDHGRGIAIMRHYFPDITYNTQGNTLRLSKTIR